MVAPLYVSRVAAPEAAARPVGGMPVIQPAETGAGAALAAVGQGVAQLGTVLSRADEAAREARATTDYLTGLDRLQTEIGANPGADAPQVFEERRRQLQREVFERHRIDDVGRAQFEARFTPAALQTRRSIEQTLLRRQTQTAIAGLDTIEDETLRRASAAGSPEERTAARQTFVTQIAEAQTRGVIDPVDAQRRLVRFDSSIEQADVIGLINRDPAAAAAALADPQRFRTLDPVKREQLAQAARTGAGQQRLLEIANAARFDPARAIGMAGRASSPDDAGVIIDRAIIPIESGGRPDVVGPMRSGGRQAFGLTQMLPATARGVARGLGLADVAALDDDALARRLLDDPALARRLGTAYLREGLVATDGSVWAAGAYYNAGPRAVAWHREAVARFGPGYSAEQFKSVIPADPGFDETRAYVDKMVARLGGDSRPLPPDVALRAGDVVGRETAQARAEEQQSIRSIAALQRSENDVLNVFQAGFTPDPARVASWLSAQERAAATGDREATKALRDFQARVELAPLVDRAWAMPAAELDAAITAERQRLQGGAAAPEQVRRLTALEAVRDEIGRARQTDPLAVAARGGRIQLRAFDPTGVAFAGDGFRALVAERSFQAQDAARAYDAPLLPFRPAEVAALRDRLVANGTPDDRIAFLAATASAMDRPAYEAAVRQVFGGDGVAAFAGGMARERPDLARSILRGAEVLKDEAVRPRAPEIREALKATLGGQLFPGEAGARLQAQIVDAALAVYADERGAAGALYDPTDTTALRGAIERVTGTIVSRNGRRVPIPSGMTEAQFAGVLDRLEDRDFGLGGVRDGAGRPVSAATIVRSAQLMPLTLGGARYAVVMPTADKRGAPLVGANGEPLVLDIAAIAEARRARRPDAPEPVPATAEGRRRRAIADSLVPAPTGIAEAR